VSGTDHEASKVPRLALSQEQINGYMAEGYLGLGSFLDTGQVDLLRKEYDLEIEKARREGYLSDLAAEDYKPRDRDADAQMLEVLGVSMRNMLFRKLPFLDKILDVVEDLIGPNIRLLQDSLLYKPPRKGSVVYWHQDNFHHQCSPANMVSGWLTLDDVNGDSGAMQMIPGSHLRPTWEDFGENTKVDASKAKVVELPAGGIVFHHCQVLHCSGPNRSDRPRRAVVMRFLPIGTRSPLLLAKEWSFFVQPVLRMRV
jgi:phytanoyl-CoA hydroxylase